jgi:transcriptional regulator with XRE-family HTH domain
MPADPATAERPVADRTRPACRPALHPYRPLRAWRPSGDTLKRLADALEVTSDDLLEGAADDAARARFADRELLRQFQEVERLPDEDKHVIKTLLDAFLTKKHLQSLMR